MKALGVANLMNSPIEEGDAGVVMKKDGTFRIFNTIKDLNPNNLTDEQKAQGRTLMALSLALQMPEIMGILYNLADDPDITESLIDTGVKH